MKQDVVFMCGVLAVVEKTNAQKHSLLKKSHFKGSWFGFGVDSLRCSKHMKRS